MFQPLGRVVAAVVILFVYFTCPSALHAGQWTLGERYYVWARQPECVTESVMAEDGKNVIRVEHTGDKDWSLSGGQRVEVEPGDVLRLCGRVKSQGPGAVSISVITRDAAGETLNWTYASRQIRDQQRWTDLQAEFVVPRGVATVEPRVVGTQQATAWIDGMSLTKIGAYALADDDAAPATLENRFLKVELDVTQGVFHVTDKRTGRVWSPNVPGMQGFWATPTDKADIFVMMNLESMESFVVSMMLDANAPELIVSVTGDGPMQREIMYPPAFVSQPGDRLIVPVNEGVGYPVEMRDIRVGRLIAYGGHGVCMAFWGQVDDATGAGMMGILETPDDAAIEIAPRKYAADGRELLEVGPVWEPSMHAFRYPRRVRYVFFDHGGHVAACKRYRQYAKKIGLFKPFSEKVKTNPNIDILLGAANIWCWDWNWNANHEDWRGTKVALVREMRELGFDRILWSGGGSAEEIAQMNEIPRVLTSRYDIYQDIMDPANFEKVDYVHGDWTTEAWPHDVNWTAADGTWRRGWEVDPKDKTQPRMACAVICDAKAVPYARKRISEELKTKPFTARFIDTTVAAPWFECYHPDHPMTRTDSRKHKMELLKLIGELGLICGSETGHDASVPYCDYFEGMLSLGPYRIDEAGRDMIRLIDDVPPQIENFQVNPAVRLPLWELVYHDCVVAHWYWGDYNNKLPAVWRQRDLFNALYGTPPMYMFTRKDWDANKVRFLESYHTATPSSRATAYAEMADHRILSGDRMVQQTMFSNGVTVTVNFGDAPFTLPDGAVIAPLGWKMETAD